VVPTSRPAPTAGQTRGGQVAPDHVVVAVFENKAYDQIVGNARAAYLNGLLAGAAVLSNAHGVAHPSQPNYLALFSGSTHGVTSDRCLTPFSGRPNLAQQLRDAGRSFVGYSEDLPHAGFTGCRSGGYAAKHNPWVAFADVPADANQPYSAFPGAFDSLPTVAFVIPNLCNDMHDCDAATGDRWARSNLDPYLQWARSHNSLLIITFDENDGGSGNRILTLFAGAHIRPGIYPQAADHYSVLHTIESRYGLPPLGAAAHTPALEGIFG
jgi:acid phosphatase